MSALQKPRFYWLPNALTLGRIGLIPVLMAAILAVGTNMQTPFNAPVWTLVIFALCALSDFLDGYLARKMGLVSDFGRMLDPIADKLLVAGCLIALLIGFGPIWYVIIPAMAIIFRDIFISGTREHAALSGTVMPPTNLAKWKTAAEMLAIVLLLVGISSRSVLPVSGLIPLVSGYAMKAGLVTLWIAGFLSVYTGLHYVRAAFKRR
ncbi:MAG TPA: CDP-diacylglycerol--glycerol-3-phosphate 3-phosphatidyltransferase [Hellea balneolensis]|uniref:CDP-diacylglycerol--glycerol-3-phosphate 3-phosphatidyltransferase n=1 Tax=Hellea balneolensis TaxID=287478 RepID=A0A7C5LY61_9PROT|nr:CDP-diacylglycerol--glycerol-3-phosphate 3-phosphatidyltransferase [Hellea balneolensis]